MSLANSLSLTRKILTVPVVDITQEPTELDDSARITDTISYVGNGTYPPDTTTQVITPTDVSFTPLFQTLTNKISHSGIIHIEDTGLASNQYNTAVFLIIQYFELFVTPENEATISRVSPFGTFNLPISDNVEGEARVWLNRGNGFKIPTYFFENEDEARRVKQIQFPNGSYVSVHFNTTQNYGDHLGYTFNFSTSVDEEDFLRITSQRDNINFQQLANVEYDVDVLSSSSDNFDIRFATYDESLNLVDSYPFFSYDISVNPKHPPLLSGLKLRGSSVKYSQEAVYGFLEVRNNDATGNIEFAFRYASSDLQVSLNTSVEDNVEPPEEALNIFTVEYEQIVRDASGVDRDLAELEAEVAALQQSQATQDVQIADLQVEKFDISGGQIIGDVDIVGDLSCQIIRTIKEGVQINNDDGGISQRFTVSIDETDDVARIQAEDIGGGIEILSGFGSGTNKVTFKTTEVDIPNGDLIVGGANIVTAIETNKAEIQTNQTDILDNTNSIATKLASDGSIPMSGALNMGGSKIRSVGAPSLDTDCATKKYVDDATGGGGSQNPSYNTVTARQYRLNYNASTLPATIQFYKPDFGYSVMDVGFDQSTEQYQVFSDNRLKVGCNQNLVVFTRGDNGTGGNIELLTNSGVVIKSDFDGSYKHLECGDISCGEVATTVVSGLVTPTQNDHATSKLYVDTAIAGITPPPTVPQLFIGSYKTPSPNQAVISIGRDTFYQTLVDIPINTLNMSQKFSNGDLVSIELNMNLISVFGDTTMYVQLAYQAIRGGNPISGQPADGFPIGLFNAIDTPNTIIPVTAIVPEVTLTTDDLSLSSTLGFRILVRVSASVDSDFNVHNINRPQAIYFKVRTA